MRVGHRICSTFVSLLCLAQLARGEEPLRYHFTDAKTPVYEVTLKAEMPDYDEVHKGTISYNIKSIDPVNGQITFDCNSQFRTQIVKTGDGAGGFGPRLIPQMMGPAERDTVIDASGKVLRTTRNGNRHQLPFMLGSVGELLIQPLSNDNGQTWKIDRPITMYSTKENDSWPPQPAFFGQQGQQTENAAHETITFTRKDLNGTVLTVERQYELSTDEKIGESPVEKVTAEGTFAFDTQSGFIQSLDFKQTIEVTRKNVTAKVPVTVTARLLSGEELEKWKAAEQEAEARRKADFEQLQARVHADDANNVRDLPESATKTRIIGLDGGSPYMKVHTDHLPVIGFTVRIGNWAGHKTIGHAEPLFEKPDDLHPQGATVSLAKAGYVVGGVIVNSKEGADGLRIIFMKKTTTGVDPKSSYQSEWFGFTGKGTQTQLDGNGKLIIGTFGYQGMNMNKIGLIIAGPADSKPTKE